MNAALPAGLLSLLLGTAAYAGDVPVVSEVTATVKGGRLLLVGDARSSSVEVRATVLPDTFLVVPLVATTVNGSDNRVLISGVTRGFRVDLGAGLDELLVSGPFESASVLPGAFSYRSGPLANDLLVFHNVELRGRMSFSGVGTAGELRTIVADRTDFGGGASIAIRGDSRDLVLLAGCTGASKVQMELGLRDDAVGIYETILAGRAGFSLDAGDDLFGAWFTHFEGVLVNGGSGFDVYLRSEDVAAVRPKLRGLDAEVILSFPSVVTDFFARAPAWLERVDRAFELIEGPP